MVRSILLSVAFIIAIPLTVSASTPSTMLDSLKAQLLSLSSYLEGNMMLAQASGPTLPTWVPLPGEVAVLTQSNGKITNQFESQAAPYFEPYYYVNTVNDYSGAFKNPYWGEWGATVFWGGGHAGTNDNTVTVAEYGTNAITFKRVSDPTPWTGSTASDGNNRINNSRGNWNGTTLNLTYMEGSDGQPGAPHSYSSGDIIGPEHGGAQYGSLVQISSSAVNAANDAGADAAHKIDFDTLTLEKSNGQNRKWTRMTNNLGSNFGGASPHFTAFVPAQNRIYYAASGYTDGKIRWFDRTTNSYVIGTGTGFDFGPSDGFDSGAFFHVPERNLIVALYPQGGKLKVEWMDVSVNQPSWGGTATLSQSLSVSDPWSAATWVPDSNRIVLVGVTGDTTAAYEIEIPATLSSTWTVTRAPFGAGQTFAPYDKTAGIGLTFKKFAYDPKVKSIVYMPRANRDGADETIWVYRPRGTDVVVTPVNGSCGTAHGGSFTSVPGSNLCAVGTASAVTSGTTTYTWSCAGSNGGTTAQCSATRTILPPSPTVTLGALPQSILLGNTSTLTWSSTDAVSCAASGGWSGAQNTQGTQVVTPTTNTTYSLQCTGDGGSSPTESAIVTVLSPKFALNDRIEVLEPLNVRDAANGNLLGSQTTGVLGTVVGGPVLVGGFIWWDVNYDSGVDGWSVENYLATYVPPVPTNGVCGSSDGGSYATTPSSNLCAVGVPSSVTEGADSYTWSCAGLHGGTTAQCSAVRIPPPPVPSVVLTITPGSIVAGQSSTLSWTASDATTCTASGGWSGTKALSGTEAVSPSITTTYTIQCSGLGGTSPSQSVTLTVTPAPVNGLCGTSNGGSFSSAPTTNLCTLGTPSSVLTGSTTYTWSCAGQNGGTTAQCSATRVVSSAPVITFGANPAQLRSGQTSVLTWSVTGASSCTASGSWTGSKSATGGSQTVTVSATRTYTLTCTGAGGSAAKSVTVTVVPRPTTTFSASPTTIALGNSSTLTWTSTNALSCTGTGGWSGVKAVSGTESVSPTANTTYSLTCSGIGGTSTARSLTVSVTQPPTPVNGACGTSNGGTFSSAPTTGLCSLGTASGVTTNTNTYTWSCAGVSGGTTAQCSATRTQATTTPPSGPLASYSFEEGSGTSVLDRSGNGRHGTLVGTPTWGTGRNGLGMLLGASDNVNLGSALPLQSLQKFTFSAWMKRDAIGSPLLIGKGNSGTAADALQITYWTDGLIYFGLGSATTFSGATYAQNDANWHHVALVFDGSLTGNANRLKGYVDGVQVPLSFGFGTIPSLTSSGSGPVGIGALEGYFSSGAVDDVRLYARALSASEIMTDMNTPVTGN